MNRGLVVALVLAALTLAPGLGFAQQQGGGGSIEQLLSGEAHTKAEHETLAKYYEDQAAAARKLAEQHQQMHRAYLGGKGHDTQAIAAHCDKISEDQKALAKEYDALAKLHHEAAKKAAQ